MEPCHTRVPPYPLRIYAQKDKGVIEALGGHSKLFICSNLYISSQRINFLLYCVYTYCQDRILGIEPKIYISPFSPFSPRKSNIVVFVVAVMVVVVAVVVAVIIVSGYKYLYLMQKPFKRSR